MNQNWPKIPYISFIQHNVGKRDIAFQSTLQTAFENGIDIILFQEPHCPRDYNYKGENKYILLRHPAYNIVPPQPQTSFSNIRTRPRVLIYIRKEKNLSILPRYDIINDPDIQVIQIFGQEPFYIVNIYNEKERLEGDNLGRYTIERSLFSITLDLPFILAGDFNLHHHWWNPLVNNSSKIAKASSLVNWLKSKQASLLIDPLVIEEKGGTFYRPNLIGQSIIDLVFYLSFKRLTLYGW